jgi:hypothetical protein
MTASTTPAHEGFVQIDSADFGFTDRRWSRQFFEHAIGDEALIDTTQGIP